MMKSILADDAAIEQAVLLLQQGRLVAFPTETVYGLGADASNPGAVRRIFQAKGRPADHPLIVHIPSIDCLKDWAINIPEAAYKLAEQFWPGPLAIILKKQTTVPVEVTGGQDTVGLRMPNHPVALQLLNAFGGGIAAPSANRFCRISPTQASHVVDELGDAVDLILDGGASMIGVESTIIDLSGQIPTLLRPGHITQLELEAVLQTKILTASLVPKSSDPVLRAPGMMAVHYAPTTTAMLCSKHRLSELIEVLSRQHKQIGLLTYTFKSLETALIHSINMPISADNYAQSLYASLRELDNLKLDIILIEQPPDTEGWQAINDRLFKATSTQ